VPINSMLSSSKKIGLVSHYFFICPHVQSVKYYIVLPYLLMTNILIYEGALCGIKHHIEFLKKKTGLFLKKIDFSCVLR
jgi:hypothetical protein